MKIVIVVASARKGSSMYVAEQLKELLGHESSETTKIYVVREDEEDADDAFV